MGLAIAASFVLVMAAAASGLVMVVSSDLAIVAALSGDVTPQGVGVAVIGEITCDSETM